MSWFKKGLKAISPLAMALNKDNAAKIAAGGIGAGYADPKQMAGGVAAGYASPKQMAGGVGSAMQKPVGEYQVVSDQAKLPYNQEAAARFGAAMQANRAQMGQQMPGIMQQLGAGGQGVQNGMRMFSPQEQQGFSREMLAAGPNNQMQQFGMRNPPFYNPPPGQNMQMPQMQDFQNAYQQPQQQQEPQQAQAQRSGVNAGRVRQSAGIYKDPNTGALYGNNGNLIRAGTRRMR